MIGGLAFIRDPTSVSTMAWTPYRPTNAVNSTSDDDESLLATGTINSTITQRLRNASCLSVVSVNSTVP